MHPLSSLLPCHFFLLWKLYQHKDQIEYLCIESITEERVFNIDVPFCWCADCSWSLRLGTFLTIYSQRSICFGDWSAKPKWPKHLIITQNSFCLVILEINFCLKENLHYNNQFQISRKTNWFSETEKLTSRHILDSFTNDIYYLLCSIFGWLKEIISKYDTPWLFGIHWIQLK